MTTAWVEPENGHKIYNKYEERQHVDYILYTESKRHQISRVTSNTAEA